MILLPHTHLKAQTYTPNNCLSGDEDMEFGLQDLPSACPADWLDECIVYIKVGVYFTKGETDWAYTPTGNTSPVLPPGYTGYDFANDLIQAVNQSLQYNAPMNICNGWAYYNPGWYNTYYPNAPVFTGSPDYAGAYDGSVTPGIIPPQVMFRYYLSRVGFVDTDNSAYSKYPTEIELYLRPEGGNDGFATSWTKAVVNGVENRKGNDAQKVSLVVHELGHTTGLQHTYIKLACETTKCDEDCNETENTSCFNHPYYGSDSPDDVNNRNDGVCTCCPPIGSSTPPKNGSSTVHKRPDPLGQWGDNKDGITDTHDNNDCGSGIEAQTGYWKRTYCDEPVEITNNFMDDRYANLPGGYTAGQLAKARQGICSHVNFSCTKYDLALWHEEFSSCNLPTDWIGGSAPALPAGYLNSPEAAFQASVYTAGTCRMAFMETMSPSFQVATLTTGTIDIGNYTNIWLRILFSQQDGTLRVGYIDVDETIPTFHSLYTKVGDNTSQNYNAPEIFLPFSNKSIKLVFAYYKGSYPIQDYLGLEGLIITATGDNPDIAPPPSLTIACLTPTSATLNWQASTPASSYLVAYKKTNETNWTELTAQISESVFGTQDITTLVPNTDYEVTLTLMHDYCNGNSYAPQTTSITFTTPTETIIAGATEVCEGQTTTLTVNSPYNYFLWSNGSTAQSINVGTGTYSVTATDGVNNCSSVQEITVSEYPPFSVSLGEDITLCPEFTPITLTLNPYSIDYQIVWSTAEVNTSFITATPGTYSVTVTDANGCTATDDVSISLYPQPQPNITMTPNECTVTLTASGGVTYLWNNGSSDEAVEVAAPDTYSVTVTDANGCTGTAAYQVLPADVAPTDFSGAYMIGNPANNISGVQQDANGNELWENLSLRIAGAITVPAGKTLTIRNSNLQMVGQTAKIEVKQGAKLLIDNNSVLRADGCQNNYWQGIQAYGTPNLPHQIDPLTADPNTMNDPNAGVVYVDNATIKQAKIAFANAPVDFSAQPISHDYGNTGGMIITRNARFENNETGLYFFAFKPRNYSLVRACRFETNAPFAGDFDIFGEQIGIVQMQGFFQYPLLENTFIHNIAGTPAHQRGIGILNNEAATAIGLPEQGNTFENLFKGIDYMGGPSLASQIALQGNYFINTHKSVTLTGGVFANINNNQFWYIANGQDPDISNAGTAYGIFTDGATGFVIRNNTFNCNQPGAANPQNIGLVVRNSGKYANTVTDNLFGGAFGFANYYTGKNEYIAIDCNLYENTVHTDWKIDGLFADQGECDLFYPEKARRNTFHTPITGINGLNIDATGVIEPFNYVPQPGFEPSSASGNVDIDNDCPIPVSPTHCQLNPEDCDPDCFAGMIQAAGTEKQLVEAYTGLLQKRIELEQFEAAKQDLDAEQRDAALKALIATYTKEGNADSAWVKLNQLPLNNDENIAFYNLYAEILQGIEPPAGSGKTMSIQEQFIRTTATSTNNAVAVQAEVVMNGFYSVIFNKSLDALNKSTISANKAEPFWKLLPNPATDNVIFIDTRYKVKETMDLSVYSANGILVRVFNGISHGKSISISGIPTGIYFCLLSTNAQYSGIQKLVILP